MGFCSYCGSTTEGTAAVCNPCRAKKDAARARRMTTVAHSPTIFETLFSSKAFLACCALIAVGGVVLVMGPRIGISAGNTPTASEVEPLVRAELLERGSNCTLAHFSDLSVGSFNSHMGGWPIYASHKTVCRSGSTTITYDGLRYGQDKVAVAFVRRGVTGTVQTFTPALIEQFQQQAQEAINKSSLGKSR
jgi:hypothetical protein